MKRKKIRRGRPVQRHATFNHHAMRQLRVACNVSGHDIAKALGVGKSTYHQWETTGRAPQAALDVLQTTILRLSQ